MSAPAAAPVLSARCLALYGLLKDLAAQGALTPRIGELHAALYEMGHRSSINPRALHGDVVRLGEAGLVRTHGSARTLVYDVIGIGSTVRRPNTPLSAAALETMAALGARNREMNAGWPRPTKESAAAYDAAVAAMAFADGRPAAQSWAHSPIRPAASGRSLTGCAAAMSVEVL